MSHLPLEYLRHIADELDFLAGIHAEYDEASISSDGILQRAVARSFEIIGEATKRLGKDFCDKYSGVPWSSMARLRDKLIHHYFGIDYILVWNVIEEEVPRLRNQILEVMERESTTPGGSP